MNEGIWNNDEDQMRISEEDLLAMLKIWKSADPTTTKRKIPNIMGPICIFSSFFYHYAFITLDALLFLYKLSA